MTRSLTRAAALVAAVSLLVTACGSDDDEASTTDDDVPASTAPATGEASGTAAIPEETGPADSTLEPVVVGMINMDEGAPSYPDVSTGVDAAAEYINAQLGGIHGRPVEVRHCSVGMDQASNQQCAQELANDDEVSVVITGYVFGSGFVFPILDAAGMPTLIQTPLTSPDFTAENGYAFQGGNAGGTVGTAAYGAKFLDAESITIFAADNDAAKAAVEQIEGLPSMDGVEVSTTYIQDTAADVSADVQASTAMTSDAILSLVNGPQCLKVAQTLADLGIDTPAISTTTCAVPTTLAEAPELFEGWTIVGSLLPPLLAEGDSPELDFYRETFPEYGPADKTDSFQSLGGFSAMLAAWSVGNAAPEDLSRETWSAGLAGFTGPALGGQAEFSCPGTHFPAVCSNDVRAFQLDDQGVLTQVQDFFDPLS
jgi:branched-chain amino acid transport system substrate-binding protein